MCFAARNSDDGEIAQKLLTIPPGHSQDEIGTTSPVTSANVYIQAHVMHLTLFNYHSQWNHSIEILRFLLVSPLQCGRKDEESFSISTSCVTMVLYNPDINAFRYAMERTICCFESKSSLEKGFENASICTRNVFRVLLILCSMSTSHNPCFYPKLSYITKGVK